MVAKRDVSIDILRFIGIAFIILAHILPSGTALFQLRTFDVSLMIFVSGLAYAGRKMESYPRFVWKRDQRLLTPVYLFLAAYFVVNWLFAALGMAEMTPTEKIIGTFLLVDPNIGYVWVIRIFLTIMLVTPPLMRLERAVKKEWIFGLSVGLWLVAQYYLVARLIPLHPGRFVTDYVLYTTGYAVLFLLGLRMKRTSGKVQSVYVLFFAVAMVWLGFGVAAERGSWLKMQWYKYPPQTYYLVWGALVSLLLWSCRRWWSRWLDRKWVLFIGQNTIWIYLWHIPLVAPVNEMLTETCWIWRYALVGGCSIGICYLQSLVVGRIAAKRPDRKNRMLKFLKG